MANAEVYPGKVDVSNCDKEPIHIIGNIQSHGFLVVCDSKNFNVTRVSENSKEFLKVTPEEVLGGSLEEILPQIHVLELKKSLANAEHLLPQEIKIDQKDFLVIPGRSGEGVLLDFEPLQKAEESSRFQQQLSGILTEINSAVSVRELCAKAASITKQLFGYDRVMIYRFDENWNGEVVAEEKEAQLEPWMGLHYPASDIPAQSRKLFLKQRVRIISDVNSRPQKIIPQLSPENGQPLDISGSELRGVSPIHLEYLQNMGVGASLTAAIISNDRLWGLLACHHSSPKFINFYQRQTCRFLTQVFSNQLAVKDAATFQEKSEYTGGIRDTLVKQMKKREDMVEGLAGSETKYTNLVDCGGGAIVYEEKIVTRGSTPLEEQILKLVAEFLANRAPLVHEKNLMEVFPEAEKYKEVASGILSVQIGQNKKNRIIWFRPEVPQTVNWGGNPDNKALYDPEKKRLSPRKSFEAWSEKLRGVAKPWHDYDISAARALQENVANFIVEQQKNEITSLNNKLLDANKELEILSYGVSHDLRAPLRGIEGFAEILLEDHGGQLGEKAKDAVHTIIHSASKMDALIEDILIFAGMAGKEVKKQEIAIKPIVDEILFSFNVETKYPKTRIVVDEDMPTVLGDSRLIVHLLSNVIGNALKYSAKQKKPLVEIGSSGNKKKPVFFVKDNGIGIPLPYQDKIFEVFKRFTNKDYEGSGVGLAIAQRVVEKHGGEIWAESQKGKGTIFYFSL